MSTDHIDLQVSEEAKELLLRYISQIEEEFESPIVAVLWSEGGSATHEGVTKTLPANWNVCFYEPHKIPAEEVQEISGIKFIFNPRRYFEAS
jgi:hypothetical protein